MENHDIIQKLKDENNLRSDLKLAELLGCNRQYLTKFANYKRTDDLETLLVSAILSANDQEDLRDVILQVLLNADNNVKQRMIQLALDKRVKG